MRGEVIVLKFGASVLRNEGDLPAAVSEVYRWRRRGWGVVAVVSAFEGQTDALIAQARAFGEAPLAHAQAALVAGGERESAAMLALALERAGTPAVALDEAGAELAARGEALDSMLVGVDAERIRAMVRDVGVVVVPGFLGRDSCGRVVLLGRGGSDYSALYVASALGARCRLVKDVPGLFERDPARDADARLFRRAHWGDALGLDGGIVQHKGVRFAREASLAFEVAGLNAALATKVGPWSAAVTDRPGRICPLRVGLLGAGTVGLQVYRALEARPGLFEVVGVAVRRAERAVERGVRPEIVTTDCRRILEQGCDVIVEALGGLDPASSVVTEALERGTHVVTANKTLVSRRWSTLVRAKRRGGATLRYSASVGGGVPILETARRWARGPHYAPRDREGYGRLTEVEAVLNGTTTFVLDRVGAGRTFAEAIAEAQRLGFAEADPSKDIRGIDAAEKAAILVRVGFGVRLHPDAIERRGIDGLDERIVQQSYRQGRKWRLVASVRREAGVHGGCGLCIKVETREVEADSVFGSVSGAGNAAVFTGPGGHEVIRGLGAGSWPTAEVVLADLLDISRGGTRTGRKDARAIAREGVA